MIGWEERFAEWWSREGRKVDPDINDVTSTISRQVFATQETQIRDALIALGWTPPQFDHQKSKDYEGRRG